MSDRTAAMPRFDGYVFDMDGTLVDNMAFHHRAWCEFGRRQGWDVDASDFWAKVGHGNVADAYRRLFGREAIDAGELSAFGEAKEAVYREMYRPHMKPVPGLREFLAVLRSTRPASRMGICTNADMPNVDFILDGLGLRAFFASAVVGSDVPRGKPDPMCYRLAAERLGLPGQRCVAFEDTPFGVAAARGAGMAVVCVATTHAADALADADLVVRDYTDVRLYEFLGVGPC